MLREEGGVFIAAAAFIAGREAGGKGRAVGVRGVSGRAFGHRFHAARQRGRGRDRRRREAARAASERGEGEVLLAGEGRAGNECERE